MFDRKGNVMQDILKVLNCLIKFSKKVFISENAIKLCDRWPGYNITFRENTQDFKILRKE